jgi:hypothetical protein
MPLHLGHHARGPSVASRRALERAVAGPDDLLVDLGAKLLHAEPAARGSGLRWLGHDTTPVIKHLITVK